MTLPFESQYLTLSERDFLITEASTIPVIYMLPKVHKPFEKFPPGHPIVASKFVASKSKFVNVNIRPPNERLPSYLRDTSDIIDQISKIHLDNETILLFTMDIGLTALCFFLDSCIDNFPPTNFLK